MTGFCFSCKKSVEMKEAELVEVGTHGRKMTRGECAECGTIVYTAKKMEVVTEEVT